MVASRFSAAEVKHGKDKELFICCEAALNVSVWFRFWQSNYELQLLAKIWLNLRTHHK